MLNIISFLGSSLWTVSVATWSGAMISSWYINPPSLSFGEGSGKVLFVEDHCLVTAAPTTKVPIGKTGLPLLAYYIIAAGLGLFLITIVIAMVVCCTLRRRKRKREGTWSSTRGQNGHHHHNGGVVVVDVSTCQGKGRWVRRPQGSLRDAPSLLPYI